MFRGNTAASQLAREQLQEVASRALLSSRRPVRQGRPRLLEKSLDAPRCVELCVRRLNRSARVYLAVETSEEDWEPEDWGARASAAGTALVLVKDEISWGFPAPAGEEVHRLGVLCFPRLCFEDVWAPGFASEVLQLPCPSGSLLSAMSFARVEEARAFYRCLKEQLRDVAQRALVDPRFRVSRALPDPVLLWAPCAHRRRRSGDLVLIQLWPDGLVKQVGLEGCLSPGLGAAPGLELQECPFRPSEDALAGLRRLTATHARRQVLFQVGQDELRKLLRRAGLGGQKGALGFRGWQNVDGEGSRAACLHEDEARLRLWQLCLGCVPRWFREGRLTSEQEGDAKAGWISCGPREVEVAWSQEGETVLVPEKNWTDPFMGDGLTVTVTAGQGSGPLWAAEQAGGGTVSVWFPWPAAPEVLRALVRCAGLGILYESPAHVGFSGPQERRALVSRAGFNSRDPVHSLVTAAEEKPQKIPRVEKRVPDDSVLRCLAQAIKRVPLARVALGCKDPHLLADTGRSDGLRRVLKGRSFRSIFGVEVQLPQVDEGPSPSECMRSLVREKLGLRVKRRTTGNTLRTSTRGALFSPSKPRDLSSAALELLQFGWAARRAAQGKDMSSREAFAQAWAALFC